MEAPPGAERAPGAPLGEHPMPSGATAPEGAGPREGAVPADLGRRPWSHVARLGAVALGGLAVGAWGGIAPFVGPLFGFSVDGTSAWTWNLAHALLAVVPGAVAVLAALWVLGRLRGLRAFGGRGSLRLAGVVGVLSGAWFVVGATAWPVLEGSRYFVASPPWGTLMRELGFAFGPGLLLVAFGAYALGWAGRAGAAVVRERDLTRRALERPRIVEPATGAGLPDGATPAGARAPRAAGAPRVGEPVTAERGSEGPLGPLP